MGLDNEFNYFSFSTLPVTLSSALFLLAENVVIDGVTDVLKPLRPELITTNLSKAARKVPPGDGNIAWNYKL
jgi:uncharacterized membrane protein